MAPEPGFAGATLRTWSRGPAPGLFLSDLRGRDFRLEDYRGTVVLVHFWATWCEPCREEMPSLEKLKRRFTGRPLLVVAVNVDEPEARIRKFLAQFPLSFPILLDPGRQATKAWNVRLMPTTFVIGADGRIRYAASGGLDWSAPEVVERIADLFGKG